MKPLEARKQLLIAESELNRTQLVQGWRTIAADARSLADRARTIRGCASAAATVVAVLASGRHPVAALAAKKPSWVQTVMKVAGVVSAFWLEFRARRKT